MNRSGRQATVFRGGVCRALVVGMIAAAALCARGAVADFLVSQDEVISSEGHLGEKSERQARALAYFAEGLFEEESDGPEKALESYRRVLDLDPGNTELAIKVSYDYLRRGDTAEAISVLKDAIKAAPKDYSPYLALSTIYLRHLNKPEPALKHAQTALSLAPKNSAPYETLWEIYQSQGQSEKAEDVLDRAARLESTDSLFWLSLAQLRARTVLASDTPPSPEAVAKFSKLLDKAAENAGKRGELLAQTADLYVLIGQAERATPLYQRALEFRPNLPGARERLAGCYIQSGKTADAIGVLEEIVKINPLDISAYDQLAQLHIKNGTPEKALANFEQALIIEPQRPERYVQIAELLLNFKSADKAAQAAAHLAEARRRFPQTGLLTYYHGVALSQAKKHEDAMRTFEQALVEAGNNQPDLLNSDFYFQYGAAAEQAGRYIKAAEQFRKSIELDPANAARSYNYLGYMWVERNENLDEAEQLIRRATEMEPGNGAYIDSLGWLFFKKGRFEEALAELLKAAESLPEPDPVVFDHIGDTCAKLGRNAEAVLYWQKALQLDPEDKKITAKLDKAAEKVAQQPKGSEAKTPVPAN